LADVLDVPRYRTEEEKSKRPGKENGVELAHGRAPPTHNPIDETPITLPLRKKNGERRLRISP
jgi:hypothetical protein